MSGGFSEVARSQRALDEDIAAVRAYGAERPDVFGGSGFDNGSVVRVMAGFTRDLDEHADRLRRLVGHPDRLEVLAVPASVAEIERIRAAIMEDPGFDASSPLRQLGPGFGTVRVRLASFAEEQARRLVDRYGAAVEVWVGAFPYPMDREGPVRARELPSPPSLEVEGLEAHIDLDVGTLEPGAGGEGRVVLANRGSGRIELDTTQPLSATLVDPATGRVVGGFVGGVAGTGLRVDLAPGQETAIRLLIGSDSLDPALGYVVPPGSYRLRVFVPVGTGPDRAGVPVPEADVEVVPARR